MGKTIGERLALIRGDKSQSAFAEEFGLSKTTIARYENGTTFPDVDLAAQICDKYDIRIAWLIYGREPRKRSETPPPGGNEQECLIPQWQKPDHEMFTYVPLVSARLAAGGGSFALSGDVVGYYAFRKDWLKKTASDADNVVLSIVSGDSMSPTLKENDFVMIDAGQTRIIDDLIYAIRIEDTIMIKRLRHRPGDIIKVVADDRDKYEAYEISRQDIHVLGQVVWSCRSYLTGV